MVYIPGPITCLIVVPIARLLESLRPGQDLRHHEELHSVRHDHTPKHDRALTVFTTFSNIKHI